MLEAQQHAADGKVGGKPASASNTAAATAGPKSTAAAAAARHSSAGGTTEGLADKTPPPEPCSLLSPELASVLNPLVMYARKVCCLPDAPATMQQLDGLCALVKLRAVWPPLVRRCQTCVL